MSERWNQSVFRSAAVASDLVTREQLAQATELAGLVAAASGSISGEPPDEIIAEQLVALGYLNPWQVEQLKAGRTRFQLGDYRIVDSIGQGGMGQVFQAVHTLLGRVEAIKVLPRDRSTPENIASFRHEIRAQAQLDHPNLVRVSYAGFDGNVYFLVTEFVPGADLRRLVRANGPLGMDQAANILDQVAAGLEYVHGRGLVHRDVKPGNVLVTPEGIVKLSDMGLAGFTTDSGLVDPRAGKIVGTADYLSPEHIRTPDELTPAADVYSLGCTLYYAATGKVPFPGGSASEKARRHLNDTPLHPRHLNPELSETFVELIADMMAKEVGDRITTAEEVRQRVSPWLQRGIQKQGVLVGNLPPAAPPKIETSGGSDVFELTPKDMESKHSATEIAVKDSSAATAEVVDAGEDTVVQDATISIAAKIPIESANEGEPEIVDDILPADEDVEPPPLPEDAEAPVEAAATGKLRQFGGWIARGTKTAARPIGKGLGATGRVVAKVGRASGNVAVAGANQVGKAAGGVKRSFFSLPVPVQLTLVAATLTTAGAIAALVLLLK